MAVDFSWLKDRLEKDSVLTVNLPDELRTLLLHGRGKPYLDAIATASLHPRCTDRVFTFFHPLAAEIAARWTSIAAERPLRDEVNILACLAKVLPFAPFLLPLVKDFIRKPALRAVIIDRVPLLSDSEDHHILLLALFRLLSHDFEAFSDLIGPVFFSSFLSSPVLVVRYLAIQGLCIVMKFADALSEKLVIRYLGDGPVVGVWEDQEIDYRFLKLLEERRWESIAKEIECVITAIPMLDEVLASCFASDDLLEQTTSLGGVLVTRDSPLQDIQQSFVGTETASRNLRNLGRALHSTKPTLLVGSSNSGKTTLIHEAARLTNKLSSMVILHLNEQTDAKSLLGVYTSSTSGTSFVWQPGVITKAVQEGRWVLIEDIDRAPADVVGVLRPIIEHGHLFLASRKERIKPQTGFRIFATSRSSRTSVKSSIGRNSLLFSEASWNIVHTEDYDFDEISTLLKRSFPSCDLLLTAMLMAHQNIFAAYGKDIRLRAVSSRLPTLRDLVKWCQRATYRLAPNSKDRISSLISEATMNAIFKDAIDCYAALHSNKEAVSIIAEHLAKALNQPRQLVEHTLSQVDIQITELSGELRIGRSVILKLQSRLTRVKRHSAFAFTDQVKKTLESIAAAVACNEPLLLVGETGVGKTTIVQHLAESVNQKVTVVNLSQQSEASDLLGGLKPITSRSLIIPMIDHFQNLFDDTFSSKRNEKFQLALAKAVAKQNWARLVLLWKEAVQLASDTLQVAPQSANGEVAPSTKRRKLDAPKFQQLRQQWAEFSFNLDRVKAQVDSGDQSHVFAFVEGRLVQAVRSGHWLLLDEINLASPDTLDHIIGLLNNGINSKASILLTESGNMKRVEAHPNFRVFAAMNPATDTGKKDLILGVRSRFTEIFVSPGDDNLNDLVQIIESHIGPLCIDDKKASWDIAKAYLELCRLNKERKLTDGAGEVPHFSIRSLSRCLQYVRHHASSHGLRRAIYEGFSMSFFTTLSKESEDLSLHLVNNFLLSNVKNMKSFLSQSPKINFNEYEHVTFRHHLVAKGSNTPDQQPHYIRTPSVERNLVNLARAVSMRRFPVLLQGPTSAGKTSMVEYLAKFSGNTFVRINNHEHTDLQEYLGGYATGDDGKLEYREGVLVEALRNGYWIVLDELNLAPSDVLEALNRLLDDNRELLIPESQEIVKPHPNFLLFATQNPAGLYGGRKRLSRAFRNRFLELHFDDIPQNELEVILTERARIAPSYCRQIVEVYKRLSMQRQSSRLFDQRGSFATLRDLFRWASRPIDDRQQLANHGFMLLGERVREPAERQLVKRTIEEVLRVQINEHAMYDSSAVPEAATSASNLVWTAAMRRLLVLVTSALKNNEPVLLVGETGCGKTQICQTVAEVFGKRLDIYNAHSNTESGDLLGSQRPLRHRTELSNTLFADFALLQPNERLESPSEDLTIEDLIASFKEMDTSHFDQNIVRRTKTNIAAYQSLFTWVDGSLVRAMKDGNHFLLDEISLADDSVLERLNSLLEPSRTILLAEKGAGDNLVVAQSGFKFLATMNPGGDYGKRELSAALRNRLTEIWVPPLSRHEDILPILTAKLVQNPQDYATKMLEFATWFGQQGQSTVSPRVSIRSLLAWADFMNLQPEIEPDVSFIHGAAMIYIDSIGANPAAMTSAAFSNIDISRKACVDRLQRLVNTNVAAVYYTCPQIEVDDDFLKVGVFYHRRTARISPLHGLNLAVPTTVRNTLRVVRALQMNRPLLLEGNPGVGKTAIVSAVAQIVGKPLTRINLSDQTDLMDLFGADAPSDNESLGRFTWRNGPLLDAMQTGGWVLLDEMNLASQSVLEGLNACLDHRQEAYIAELDKTFQCHPEFVLFAAQNPHSQGGGRKGLPASFVNRFTVVYADPFEQKDLLQISRAKKGSISEEQLSAMISSVEECSQKLESAAFQLGGPWELNLRDVNRWLELCHKLPQPEQHFRTVISQRFRGQLPRHQAEEVCLRNLNGRVETNLYNRLSSAVYQIGTAFLQRDLDKQLTLTDSSVPKSLLAYAHSVVTAIEHNWPVILCGRSGCGKISMLRFLASVRGAELIEFDINSDTDTIDLIGGFEQYDIRRDVVAFCDKALGVFTDCAARLLKSEHRISQVLLTSLEAIEECQKHSPDLHNLRNIIQSLAKVDLAASSLLLDLEKIIRREHAENSKFVWNDGVLVDAIMKGSWIVLNNANLCNPSVLDRLNSLLEPNGSLVINEQHSSSEGSRLVHPHPNFRIFLAMDPKFGELSRAMRNRSLEIFLDIDTFERNLFQLPKYCTDSRTSRLRMLCNDEYVHQATRVILYENPSVDNLSPSEMKALASRPEMFNSSPEIQHWVSRKANAESGAFPAALMKACQDLMESLQERLPSTIGLHQGDQPSILLFNEPLLAAAGGAALYWEHVARRQQLMAANFELFRYLEECNIIPPTNSGDNVSILQRTSELYLQSKRARSYDHLPPACTSLLRMSFSLGKMLSSLSTDPQSNSWAGVRQVYFLIQDLLTFFSANAFDSEQLQAYMTAAGKLIQNLEIKSPGLWKSFKTCLDELGSSIRLRTGRSLERMWSLWKACTVASADQLRAQIEMEQLISKFDNLCLSLAHSRSSLAAVRSSIVKAHSAVVKRADALDQIAILNVAIENLARERKTTNDISQVGHFSAIFATLLRRLFFLEHDLDGEASQTLILFAQPSDLSLDRAEISKSPADILHRFSVLSYQNQTPLMAGNLPGEVPSVQLTSLISNVWQQPLSQLGRAQEELLEITKAITGNVPELMQSTLQHMIKSVQSLVGHIFTSHHDALTPEVQSYISDNTIEGFLNAIIRSGTTENLLNPPNSDTEYFYAIFEDHLVPCLKSLTTANEIAPNSIGESIVSLSIAIMKLMIPDKAYDPALYPALEVARHHRRISELQQRIQTHVNFQMELTGQRDSLMIRMLQRDLSEIGGAPSSPAVARPKASEIHLVQQELSNVLRSIVESEVWEDFLQKNKVRNVQLLQQIQSRIPILLDRLSNLNRSYDDIVLPVVYLLKILSVGLRLWAMPKHFRVSTKTRDVLDMIPLLRPKSIPTYELPDLSDISSDAGEESSLLTIKLFATHHQFNADTLVVQAKIARCFKGIADRFYEQWKENLIKDQENAESNAKYYAYRGADEDTEADEIERSALFPTFDGQDDLQQPVIGNSVYNARSTSIKLAETHRLFYASPDKQQMLKEVLSSSANLACAVQSQTSNLSGVLPAIFLQFEEKLDRMKQSERAKNWNIYIDTDFAEVKNLFTLVQEVCTRFHQITERWPEHANPIEVLAFCDQILQFAIEEPIAKLMTKAEKLFEIVSQWQSIASREWSVSNLVESLTRLIIHWRRLELSSWSRLLDIETEKETENADSWYFVAYEAVIHNSCLVVQQETGLKEYCQELARTLEEFFKSTNLGQFSARLALLHNFGQTLIALAGDDNRLLPIYRTVQNVVEHYKRYETGLNLQLENGKLLLEKNIKEQIQLASWKDTNVIALRDSARRTHHKLFKIIKKYRKLLSQPVSSFKAADITIEELLLENDSLQQTRIHPENLETSLDLCQQHIKEWISRPERLKNPQSATLTMRHVYSAGLEKVSVHEELAVSLNELRESVKELRSQTPRSFNKENAALIRDLKQRKRRLLADTLKDLVQMGIRRNLGTTELAAQSSSAVVLATSPAIFGLRTDSSPTEAQLIFHDLLDVMPSIRQALVEHSADLTEGETRRGVGLLEGMLSLVLQQRISLAEFHENVGRLKSSISSLVDLQGLEASSVTQSDLSQTTKRNRLLSQLTWLPELLDLSCHIIEFQSSHARLESAPVTTALSNYAILLRDHKVLLLSQPQLPPGLLPDSCMQVIEKIEDTISSLAADLVKFSEKWPAFEYILTRLQPWTEIQASSGSATNGFSHGTVGDVDSACQKSCNMVFVALQQYSKSSQSAPVTTDEQGWLVKSDSVFNSRAEALHLESIFQSIQDVLSCLHRTVPEELPTTLALVSVATPILQQYYLICEHLYNRKLKDHLELCRLATFLAKTFTVLSSEGFCTPPEPSDGEEQSGKVESGTGLGDGEGAEDISKDVGEDEDLSEFAQGGDDQKSSHEEMEKSKDAVDMGADDLEGEMGSNDEDGTGEDKDDKSTGEEAEDHDFDEETGSVDDLDPSAVDEKMWNEKENEAAAEQKEMMGQKAEGQKTDDQTAKPEGEKADSENGDVDEKMQEEQETVEDGEGGDQPEPENLDPHLQEEQALELPEEMQLNGEEKAGDDAISDDGMQDLSDIDQSDVREEVDKLSEPEADGEAERQNADDLPEEDDNAEVAGQDEEVMEDVPDDMNEDKDSSRKARDTDMAYDADDNEAADTGLANQQQNDQEKIPDENQPQSVTNPAVSASEQKGGNEEEGTSKGNAQQEGAMEISQREDTRRNQQDQALKTLADVLEQYHQRREILTASEERQQGQMDQDIDMADADFEHLRDEEDTSNTQALGPAQADQVQTLDEGKAIEDKDATMKDDLPFPEDSKEPDTYQQESLAERFTRLQTSRLEGTAENTSNPTIPDQQRQNFQEDFIATEDMEEETENHDLEPPADNQPEQAQNGTSVDEASQLWSACLAKTHILSTHLTEQLRLILQPTTATKLRGDFRSGKRLNIRRIIPYIASGYKRDKIWMRRSIPTKRNYQIMLAVDDSKSMSECGADVLALETLCMLARSLSMLEVGELCIVAFGGSDSHSKTTTPGVKPVRVAHHFSEPFNSTSSGQNIFKSFTFAQTSTDVKALVSESINLFRDARLKSSAREASELWQLQLIISDGHCDDHDTIRRLVRQAKEEKIMIVFVIVDNLSPATSNDSQSQSIVDLKTATFERSDPDDPNSEMIVKTRRYLETFPFPYYVVVRDVIDLPGVLSRVLKGWFESVMEI